VFIAKSLDELREKKELKTECMHVKVLKVNIAKTKSMESDIDCNETKSLVKWPSRVFKKGVRSNLIQCTQCNKWVH